MTNMAVVGVFIVLGAILFIAKNIFKGFND